MRIKAELVPASPAHIGRIALRMREADRIECGARGRNPKQALRLALRSSSWALTAMVDGKPEAMLGIAPVSIVSDKACPWFLGTDEVYRRGRDMLRLGRHVIAQMHEHSRRLENSVSADNDRAIALLLRWGFTIEGPSFMDGGVKFLRFWREVENDV